MNKKTKVLVGAVDSSFANDGMSVLFAMKCCCCAMVCSGCFVGWGGIVGESINSFSRSNYVSINGTVACESRL